MNFAMLQDITIQPYYCMHYYQDIALGQGQDFAETAHIVVDPSTSLDHVGTSSGRCHSPGPSSMCKVPILTVLPNVKMGNGNNADGQITL